MWRDILDFARQLLTLSITSEQNTQEIKALRQQVGDLAELQRASNFKLRHEIESLRKDLQHYRESERQERKTELLQIENMLLRSDRQLPPATDVAEKSKVEQDN